MIRSNRLLLFFFIQCMAFASASGIEPQPSMLSAKLHPSLSALVQSHETIFRGARVFDTYGLEPKEIGVLVYTSDLQALRNSGIRVQSALSGAVTARVSVGELATLAMTPGVQWVDPGTANYPASDVSLAATGAPIVHAGFAGNPGVTGKGVIVLIYDTGIDFMHRDFCAADDPSRSRILSIWDQTITPTGSEKSPQGFTYGVEYSNAQINAELQPVPARVVREQDTHGHGTHVAGTAAGNGTAVAGMYIGMAPDADIVVVKGGNGSFNSVNMIDGLQYAENIAVKYNKPVVVNWSIGGQTGPHDGTSPYEVAIDNFIKKPGRVVCTSAGNDGDSPIHRSGMLGQGSVDTIEVVVPRYYPTSGTENDAFTLDVWARSPAALDAEVVSPSGIVYSRLAQSDGDCSNTADGTISLWNWNTNASNGHRNVQLYVHDKTTMVPKDGAWKLVLKNPSTESVQFDAWLCSTTIGGYTIELTAGDNYKTLTMPATSEGAITTASYVTKWSWPTITGVQYMFLTTIPGDHTNEISMFSGVGPTADGRDKPDIAAPGQGITAAMSSKQFIDSGYCAPQGKHYLRYGTSMASPHTAGACALLLSANPSLTAEQIKTILKQTADNDSYTAQGPAYTWGSGKLDVLEAIARVYAPGARISRTMLAYDSASFNYVYVLTGTTRVGVRLSPTLAGVLTRGLVDVTTQPNHPIGGKGTLLCEVYGMAGGQPGAIIGSTTLPLAMMNAGSLNSIPLLGSKILVEKGKEYYIVMSMSNASDTLKIRTDAATGHIRSVTKRNGVWSEYANNFRIRAELMSTEGPNDVPVGAEAPLEFALNQNYPNPFNPSTVIAYTTPKQGPVRLTIFDVLGREVCRLVQTAEAAGRHQAVWNGRTSHGVQAAAGVYFYRLDASGMSRSKKMLLLK